jgi:hypothetical protein
MTSPDDATLEAADRLERSMSALTAEMQSLGAYGKRNRHLIVGLAISLVLDLALSVVVWMVAAQAREASDRAAEASSAASLNRQAQVVTCESGNEARAAQVRLWSTVLDLSAQVSPQTPERARAADEFRAYVVRTFAPRDCQAVVPPVPR